MPRVPWLERAGSRQGPLGWSGQGALAAWTRPAPHRYRLAPAPMLGSVLPPRQLWASRSPPGSSAMASRVPALGLLPSCPSPSGRGAGWRGIFCCNHIHCSEASVTLPTLQRKWWLVFINWPIWIQLRSRTQAERHSQALPGESFMRNCEKCPQEWFFSKTEPICLTQGAHTCPAQSSTLAAGEAAGSLAMGTPGSRRGVPKSVTSRCTFLGVQQGSSRRKG